MQLLCTAKTDGSYSSIFFKVKRIKEILYIYLNKQKKKVKKQKSIHTNEKKTLASAL